MIKSVNKRTQLAVEMMLIAAQKQEATSSSGFAKHLNISVKYAEQVLLLLRKSGLLLSKKGADGGFVLAKAPSAISMATIIEAIEGKSIFAQAGLKAKGFWLGFFEVVDTYFEQSLQDVLVKVNQERVLEYSI